MHPERGPVVFTTQDQLFAHFAEEHANPETKGDEVDIISSQNFGTPSLGQENNDTRHVKLRQSNIHPTITSGKEQIFTTDNTKNLEGTQLVLGDTLQNTVTPKILISTPPQLHHSCPVCHKVIIFYSNTHISIFRCNLLFENSIYKKVYFVHYASNLDWSCNIALIFQACCCRLC